jgi:uncharacterized protein with von Willebrand factor type A (vWA) domain
MDAVVNEFIHILKLNGVRVSPVETIDALRALAFASLDDRETVRIALCSSLIKDARDIELFDHLFDTFFSLPGEGGHHHHHDHDHDHAHEEPKEPTRIDIRPDEGGPQSQEHTHDEPTDVRDYFDPDKMAAMFNMHRDPNRLSLSAMSQHLILNRNKGLLDLVMKQLTHHMRVRRIRNIAGVGDLAQSMALEQLDMDMIANAGAALLEDLVELDAAPELIERLARQIDGVIANLPELLKQYMERELNLRGAEIEHELEHLESAYTYDFSEDERREMAEIVRRLGRTMRGALSNRRKMTHSGRINLSRTVRGSLKFEGVPFQPVLTSKRRERPRLVVICDVSLSVRNTARFMLHLLYSLQSLFTKVRSFVFVSDLAEITGEVERSSIDEAIGMVFSGQIIDVDENSNYGRALEIFYERHMAAITGRTTVIILGDGRGNFTEPNAWILEEIRRRCKQLIWLTPEQRRMWKLGSDMPTYAPICHRVEVVRNLDQLGKVAEDLVRRAVVA